MKISVLSVGNAVLGVPCQHYMKAICRGRHTLRVSPGVLLPQSAAQPLPRRRSLIIPSPLRGPPPLLARALSMFSPYPVIQPYDIHINRVRAEPVHNYSLFIVNYKLRKAAGSPAAAYALFLFFAEVINSDLIGPCDKAVVKYRVDIIV